MNNLVILSGNSNIPLARKISRHLNVELDESNIPTQFANSEYHSRIKSNLRGKDVYIINTGCINQAKNLSINDIVFETLILVDACRRSMASSVNIIMPNYPYSRGDKKDEPRAPIPAKLVANLFTSVKIDRLVSVDLHSTQIQGYIDIPFDNLYSSNIVIECLNNNVFKNFSLEERQNKFIVVSPDAGASKRTLAFSSRMKLDAVIMHKQRSYIKKNLIEKTILIQEKDSSSIKNKIAIIYDDIADTCGTLMSAINTLVENGIKEVICVITHGIFSKNAIEKINNCTHIKEFYVSDSIPQDDNVLVCTKLKIYTISNLLGDCIRRIINKDPISDLFVY